VTLDLSVRRDATVDALLSLQSEPIDFSKKTTTAAAACQDTTTTTIDPATDTLSAAACRCESSTLIAVHTLQSLTHTHTHARLTALFLGLPE